MESVVSKITDSAAESVVSKIVDYSFALIGNLIDYHDNMKTLEAEVENLGDIKTGVQLSVNAAKRNGEVIGPEVERWLTTVNGLIEEVKTFLEGEVEINNRGWWSRYSLSREAKKKTQAVTELKAKGSFHKVAYPAPPLGIEHMATGGFTDFESRKLTMGEIMAALKDDNIIAIGICGLGGMGKTTTVKEVWRRAKVGKLFDEIVIAVVTQTPNLIAIQDEIAEQLGLELKENSLSGRAATLWKSLLDCGRVLIILDDVWKSSNWRK